MTLFSILSLLLFGRLLTCGREQLQLEVGDALVGEGHLVELRSYHSGSERVLNSHRGCRCLGVQLGPRSVETRMGPLRESLLDLFGLELGADGGLVAELDQSLIALLEDLNARM